MRGETPQSTPSHIEDGYVMVKYSGSASKIKVQIITPGRTYNYDLNTDGRYEVFPLQAGNGSYKDAGDAQHHPEAATANSIP